MVPVQLSLELCGTYETHTGECPELCAFLFSKSGVLRTSTPCCHHQTLLPCCLVTETRPQMAMEALPEEHKYPESQRTPFGAISGRLNSQPQSHCQVKQNFPSMCQGLWSLQSTFTGSSQVSQAHSTIVIGPHCPSLTRWDSQAIPPLSISPLTLYLHFIEEDSETQSFLFKWVRTEGKSWSSNSKSSNLSTLPHYLHNSIQNIFMDVDLYREA